MLANSINRNLTGCILLSIILAMFSCKKSEIVNTQTQLITPFTGITETDVTGPELIGKVDSSDWKPLMDCPSSPKILHVSSTGFIKNDTVIDASKPTCTKIYPVYPNPAITSFTIMYHLSEEDSVVITLNSTPSNVLIELVKSRLMSGQYALQVNCSDLQPAIYRVYITVYSQSGVLHSYGDVQII
jgi:hypothetical protein